MRGNVNIYSPASALSAQVQPWEKAQGRKGLCQSLPAEPCWTARRGLGLFNTDFAVCFATSSFSMVLTAESMAAWRKTPAQEQISTLQPAVLISR